MPHIPPQYKPLPGKADPIIDVKLDPGPPPQPDKPDVAAPNPRRRELSPEILAKLSLNKHSVDPQDVFDQLTRQSPKW